jgi:hypothetical protein
VNSLIFALAAAAAAATATPAAAPDPTTWKVEELGGSAAGEHFFVAQVASKDDVTNVSDKKVKAKLQVRCDRRGLFVSVFWPDFVQGDTYHGDRVVVDFKLDGQGFQHQRMTKSDRAAIAMGKNGLVLLKQLSKGENLTVRVPDMHGGQEATFSIEGLAEVYSRIKPPTCG